MAALGLTWLATNQLIVAGAIAAVAVVLAVRWVVKKLRTSAQIFGTKLGHGTCFLQSEAGP